MALPSPDRDHQTDFAAARDFLVDLINYSVALQLLRPASYYLPILCPAFQQHQHGLQYYQDHIISSCIYVFIHVVFFSVLITINCCSVFQLAHRLHRVGSVGINAFDRQG